jgi:dephospho-CoA kinase
VTVRIGIGGPIGCGKSTVAGWLRELGAVVVDADELARETARGEPAADGCWPLRSADRDGGGDRPPGPCGDRVRRRPPSATSEAIVHPAVRRRIEERIAAAELESAPAVASRRSSSSRRPSGAL